MKYDKALSKVKEVLEENFVIDPPIRVDEIARNYGLTVVEADLSEENADVAGVIDAKTKTIYVNKKDTDTRKAFTIAHELGHWLLHQNELKKDPDKYGILLRTPIGRANNDPIEKEANFFAANLLVPRDLLKKYYKEKQHQIGDLAKIFGVSRDVIGYRLKDEKLYG